MKLTVIQGMVYIIPREGQNQKCIPMREDRYRTHGHTMPRWRLAKDSEIERSYPDVWAEYDASKNIERFDDLKKDDLIALAEKEGVDLPSGATKDDIKKILLKNR